MDRGSCYTQGMTPKEHITAILKASTTGIQAAGYVKYTNRVFKVRDLKDSEIMAHHLCLYCFLFIHLGFI